MKFKKDSNQNGFIAVMATILVLIAMIAIGVSITNLIVGQYELSASIIDSAQAYFTAEAGVEDAILRIRKGLVLPASYTLTVGGASTDIVVSDAIGGSRVITSEGDKDNSVRKIEAVHNFGGEQVSFFFGAQVGAGGISMGSNAKVEGNVFSNGSIIGSSSARITGDASIAGDGNRVEDVTVEQDIQVYSCKDATILGTLYLAGGSEDNCSYGSLDSTGPVANQPLPITLAQINQWKDEAEQGGVYGGNYVFSNNENVVLGPLKIDGDLVFSNNNTLTMLGTIWVTGNIQTGNNTIIKLDNSYGPASGVLVGDGVMQLANNAQVLGSGLPGSEMMLLSTSPDNPAINIANNLSGGIFYASDGFIKISNNGHFREVTGYGLVLDNNVIIEYEIGLSSLFFSSGPSSGWDVEAWREIE